MAINSRITNLLLPSGTPIGRPGSRPKNRVVSGGMAAAQRLFEQLSLGGTDNTPATYPGKGVDLSGGSGWVGLRPISKTGPPTIDVVIEGIPFRKIKFV
jgi:hypothetical protein